MKFIIKKTKKIQLFLLLFCLTAGMGVIHAQGTYTPPGGAGSNVILTTQTEVMALDTALGVNTIFNSNLIIQEASTPADPITDLSAFRNITKIEGFILIRTIKQLTELSHETSTNGVYAFDALDTITGYLSVGSFGFTNTLTNTGNFPNLSHIGGSLDILNNDSLSSIDDDNFPVLATIGGSLNINTNHMLSTIDNFPALKSIGVGLFINTHDVLTTTGDYPALTSIGGNFLIGGIVESVGNDVLTTLGDFSSLTTIEGTIRIQNNPMLSNCSGLPIFVIDKVGTVISDNGAGCGTDATLTLTTQTQVDALSLGDATLFIGNITINEPSTSTDSITDLSVFRNITEIMGNFNVTSTRTLDTLNHEIEGESGVYVFGALETISGGFLVGFGSDLGSAVTTVENFSNLRSVEGDFAVRYNRALTTLGDFPALTTIEGIFDIDNNDVLESIGDFPSLRTIGKLFSIRSHDSLTSLGDFSSLQRIGGLLRIQNNPKLSNCGGLSTRAINQVKSAGRFTISNNALGCGSTTLNNQAEVDALGMALGTATVFTGNLTINEDSDDSTSAITDLSVFRNITEIRGNFDVIFTKSLDTLSHEIEGENGEYAFGALETISGYFYLGPGDPSTTAVANIGNFPNLRSIGGNFLIRHNGFLTRVDIENFPVLRTIGGIFSIGTNHALTTIAGFPALRTIGGKLSIVNHNTLTSLGDFSSLIAIGGNFQIGGRSSENDVLTTLGDFSSLGSIRENITIENNPMLNDCSSLPTRAINSVVNAGRNISIHTNGGGCSSVTLKNQAEVDAFGTALGAATVFTGNLTIEDSTSSTDPINDLSAFSNIMEIRGNFDVISTKSLTTLSHETSAASGEYAFNALEKITGNFHVGSFGSTTSFTNTGNFPNLRNIGGNFLINYNDSLTTIDADNFPALATVGKIFSINSNPKLSTVSGLSALRSVGGNFNINNNNTLTSMGDYPALTTIEGTFFILSNDVLTDAGDYPALIAIGGNFEIGGDDEDDGNAVLAATLGDFSALTSIGGDVTIQNNPMLSNCCSLPSRALNHVANEGGNITIRYNKANGGCSHTYPPADSAVCVTAYFVLETQSEANGFPDSLTHIDNGGVFVSKNVNDLSPLSHVTKIDNLIVRGTTALAELSAITTAATSTTPAVYGGLFGLKEVNNLIVGPARDRRIVNASLDSLGYFPNLTRIGNLEVLFNPALTTFGTFDSLENVDGNLFSRSNNVLTHLGNYPALENIHGNLDLQRLPLLTHHGNFPVLDKINGSLSLGSNPLLTVLDFPNLTAVNQRILIIDNDTLSDCCALSAEVIGTSSDVFIARNAPGCQAIAGATDIAAISSATPCIVGNIIFRTQADVDSFPSSITQLRGGIVIGPDTDADPITNLNALAALTEIGHLTVKKTASLNELVTFNSTTTTKTGLGALQTIRGNLVIGSQNRGNTGLDSLGYFDELTSIGGNINIGYNTSLSRIGTFSALDTIGGFVNIRDNAALQTLGDFSALDSIESILSIYNNLALTALGDFSTLEKIGGSFSIGKSSALLSLGDFPALTQIDGFLSVKDNDAIVSLGKFPLLESIGKGSVFVPSESSIVKNVAIVVEGNPSLSSCCAVDLFVEGGANAIMSENALLFFNNNASGCNTEAEINCADFLQITANTNIGGDATQTEINIISNTRWQLSKPSTAAWITQLAVGSTTDADMLISSNDATVVLTHTANGTPQARTATLTLSAVDMDNAVLSTPTAVTIDLTQEIGTPLPYLTISATGIKEPVSPATNYTYNAISAGVTLTVDVTLTGGAATWTARASDAFVMLNPTTGGNDVDAVLTIAENATAAERTATIIFTSTGGVGTATQTLVITQEAKTTLSAHTKESLFTLYPNPTEGNLTVEGVTGNLQVYVHDLVGREVMTYSLTPSKKTLDVSNLPSGMYAITIQGEDKTWTEVLIIVNIVK